MTRHSYTWNGHLRLDPKRHSNCSTPPSGRSTHTRWRLLTFGTLGNSQSALCDEGRADSVILGIGDVRLVETEEWKGSRKCLICVTFRIANALECRIPLIGLSDVLCIGRRQGDPSSTEGAR